MKIRIKKDNHIGLENIKRQMRLQVRYILLKYNRYSGNVSWFIYTDKLRLNNKSLINYNHKVNRLTDKLIKNSVLGVNLK